MKAHLSFLALAGLLLPMTSHALTFNLTGDWLADEDGKSGIPNGALIMLVASTKDKNFDSPGENGYIPSGSDDVILGTFSATDGNGRYNRGSYISSVRVRLNDSAAGLQDLDGGDPLMVRWFPTLNEKEHSKRPPSGTIPYGEFRADEVLPGSTNAWITPGNNGATITLSITAAGAGTVYDPKGSVPANQLAANRAVQTVIAEAAVATISISAMGNGALNLSWPMLEQGIGQVQKSTDLVTWENVAMEEAVVGESSVSLETSGAERSLFYRIATEQ